MGQTVLEMTGIKKSFAGIYALNGIDFSLELGEVHALLGENGAGKSTLIKVLGGIYQPDCGLIKVNGKEVKIDGVPAARANGIGIIHQEIVLVPYLTVAQNLFLGREIRTRLGTLDEAEMNRRAADMISALGVNIKAETVVEKLTIAQQQMVEIVKAVSFNGKIIVMDEPTSSLSNEEVEQLFGIIENLRKKKVSIIYISHRMEGDEPDASGVWTGSVIYGEGQYHAFYTGYCLTAEFQQTICHATSDDGITWTKDIANPVITPMTELYEKLDWRDPYVFYNEEDENYWILISARRLDMPVTRRGCIVLYRSKNLKDWTYYGPIYSPGHTNCPECPEMYKMGGHWYLSYSRFSEFVNTIYRVSESPFGPWRKPKKDGIGGRRFYAAKSMQNDDGRRFYFGWAHDRAEQSDKGEWYWGGTFCIPHEVVPTENGELNVKLPCEYEHIFDKAVNWKYISVLGNAKDYGEKTITLNALESCSYGFLRHTEESYMLTCKIVPRETYDTFGILLKSDKEASGCLFLEFDKAMQRVSFLNLPMGVDPFWVQSCQAVPPATEPGPDGVRVCEKTMQIEDGKAIDVKIIVDHDMIEAFIDEQIAFTYRIYAKPEFETGIIAQDSNVEFYNLSISGK